MVFNFRNQCHNVSGQSEDQAWHWQKENLVTNFSKHEKRPAMRHVIQLKTTFKIKTLQSESHFTRNVPHEEAFSILRIFFSIAWSLSVTISTRIINLIHMHTTLHALLLVFSQQTRLSLQVEKHSTCISLILIKSCHSRSIAEKENVLLNIDG